MVLLYNAAKSNRQDTGYIPLRVQEIWGPCLYDISCADGMFSVSLCFYYATLLQAHRRTWDKKKENFSKLWVILNVTAGFNRKQSNKEIQAKPNIKDQVLCIHLRISMHCILYVTIFIQSTQNTMILYACFLGLWEFILKDVKLKFCTFIM